MKKTTTSLFIPLAFILIALFGCFDKPGEGKKAEKGYKICNTIIIALDSCYKENTVYPDSLSFLVPDYMKAIPADDNIQSLEYTVSNLKDSFSLTFTYTAPGVNRCTYTQEKKWKCNGYY